MVSIKKNRGLLLFYLMVGCFTTLWIMNVDNINQNTEYQNINNHEYVYVVK